MKPFSSADVETQDDDDDEGDEDEEEADIEALGEEASCLDLCASSGEGAGCPAGALAASVST